MTASRKFKLALVGTDSLRAQEINRVLEAQGFPPAGIDFFDPEVKEEFRLTRGSALNAIDIALKLPGLGQAS
jgi:hypothetical protein